MNIHSHLLRRPAAGALCLAAALTPALGQTIGPRQESGNAVIRSVDSVPAQPAPGGATKSPLEATETERNREIVRRAFSGWASGESVFGDLLADDIVWTIHGSDPVAGTYHGKEDFVERASMPLVSRLQTGIAPVVHSIWAEGDTVIVRFDGSATTTSGAPYRNQFVWIFKMEEGVIARAEAFLDLAAYRAVVDSNEPNER